MGDLTHVPRVPGQQDGSTPKTSSSAPIDPPGDADMERSRNHSNGSRFARLIAILFFSALLCGAIVGSASAMKITINNPDKDTVMTPVTGSVVASAQTE